MHAIGKVRCVAYAEAPLATPQGFVALRQDVLVQRTLHEISLIISTYLNARKPGVRWYCTV